MATSLLGDTLDETSSDAAALPASRWSPSSEEGPWQAARRERETTERARRGNIALLMKSTLINDGFKNS
ncbi:hypothetical protein G4177_06810 [Corallococcus sp. ZKHCc1 1396]|uniref:Uncharacterized protein n=1 Tax=Corallococcus soli TaxID=2710757 RepID=A0ABR9PJ08_9BACT|nr:hypothetical protein [Corallococcus soli]MBE4747889.1 hypothetical protein [Corallococcus soli]